MVPDADRLGPLRVEDAHPPLDFADAENRHLRLIDDDRRREQAPADAVIGDGEGAAAHLLRREPARAGGADQPAEPAGDPEEVSSCARWITGTMSPSLPSAVPTPMLASGCSSSASS